jgi:Protein of unknown function (DUF1488)
MPLKFTPEREIYDAERQMVRFLARDESRLVPCAVTGRALAAAALAIPWRNPIPSWFTGRSRAEFGRWRGRSTATTSWKKMASS